MITTADHQPQMNDRVYGRYAKHGRSFTCSRSLYPNGDTITLYQDKLRGEPVLTDKGITLRLLTEEGVRLTEHREQMLQAVLACHGLTLENEHIICADTDEGFASPFHRLCDGILQISGLIFELAPRMVSRLTAQVDEVLQSAATEKRFRVHRKHIYKQTDFKKLYPVDWVIQRPSSVPSHVFAVKGPTKAMFIAAATNFFDAHDVPNRTLAVVGDAKKLSRSQDEMVRSVSDEVIYGLDERTRDKVLAWVEAA